MRNIIDVMYGVEYSYYDQYSNEHRIYPVVFSDRQKAEAWIETHVSAPYLCVIEFSVNPDSKENNAA